MKEIKGVVIEFLGRKQNRKKEDSDFLSYNANRSGLGQTWIAMNNHYMNSQFKFDMEHREANEKQKAQLNFMAGFYCGYLQGSENQISNETN